MRPVQRSRHSPERRSADAARRESPPRGSSAQGAAPGLPHPPGLERSLADAVLDAAFDPIVAIGLDGVVRFANRAVQRVFGWSSADLVGRPASVLAPDLLVADCRFCAQSTPASGHVGPCTPPLQQVEVVHRDGARFLCELAISRPERGGPDGAILVCILRDLTGRARPDVDSLRARRINDGAALARIQEASTRMLPREDGQCLLEHILDAAIAVDSARSGTLQLCDLATGSYALQKRCLRSDAVAAFFGRPDFGRHPLGQALERGERVIVSDVLRSPLLRDPEERRAFAAAGIRALHCTPLVGRTGRFLGVLSTHHSAPRRPREQHVRLMDILARQLSDFVERSRTELELRRSERRLRAMLDSAIDAIVTIDGRGVVQSVNPATARIFGYGEHELIGQNVSVLMPPPTSEQHGAYLERYRRTGEARIIGTGREVQARRRDGSIFPADLSVVEVEPGALFTGVFRDITERKAAEARVRQADRMASIGTLAAGLGHDMNNVLLPVRARLNALRAADAHPAAARSAGEHLDEISRSVAYLQQLADGLHYLAADPDREPEGGAGRPTDLAAWWEQTGLLLSKAVPKWVDVASTIPSGLPPVRMDAAALTQAVLNLVVNAGEAIPAERPRRGRVTVWAKVADPPQRPSSAESGGALGSIVLGVSDDGGGMSEEVRRRAFELFFTTKPRGLGTGLGLALVRRVVEHAGGSVSIDSAPGRGTTVAMTLPAAPHPQSALPSRRGARAAARAAFVALRDARAAALVRQLLESSGCAVQAAGRCGAVAVRVADLDQARGPALRRWRLAHPRAALVLLGPSSASQAAGLSKLRAEIVDDPADFSALRHALTRALASDR